MWKLILGVIIWQGVGGLDWISDMWDCMTYTKPVIDPLHQKITLTVEEYLNTVMSFKQVKAGPDVIIEVGNLTSSIKVKVLETVAVPGEKIISIEAVTENISDSWVKTKKDSSVLRLN